MADLENGSDAATDTALFNSIVSGEPSPEPTQAEQPAAPEPATPSPADPQAGQQPVDAAMVPSSRLREEADARRNMERENADLRARLEALERRQPAPQPATPAEQPKPPEFWDDPNGFVEHRLTPLEQRMETQRISMSRVIAESSPTIGADAVKAADAALGELAKTNMAEAQSVARRAAATAHPWAALVEWHKGAEAQKRIGNDPDAFVQAEIDRMLADPAKRAALAAKVTGQPQSVAADARESLTVSPSLSRLGAPPPGANPEGPRAASDAELFESITRRKR